MVFGLSLALECHLVDCKAPTSYWLITTQVNADERHITKSYLGLKCYVVFHPIHGEGQDECNHNISLAFLDYCADLV